MFKELLSACVNVPKLPSTSYPNDPPVIDLTLSEEDTVELPDIPSYDFDIFKLGFNFFSIIFIIMYLYVLYVFSCNIKAFARDVSFISLKLSIPNSTCPELWFALFATYDVFLFLPWFTLRLVWSARRDKKKWLISLFF